MLPTPDLSHLSKEDLMNVYEPAEDTFILLDALENDASSLQDMKPLICLEIGSGSGCVSAFLSSILGPRSALYLCTDINQHAAACTVRTGAQNNVDLSSVVADLGTPFIDRLRSSVDILLFNPPYVPTDMGEAEFAQSSRNIQSSWAGGTDGMSVTNNLLFSVPTLLSKTGRFYLVAVEPNNVQRILHWMLEQYQLVGQVALKRRAGRELLYVLRFERQCL
ncbi:S-adenosyl-L-methionine-dependent methyltransferase [Sistotremastrum niveocremeum HHB9708]|uniref:S-adenosyl-L-methionine-dependent methyltransferase n=1 Tax=Sistotremastrum niveocremeum HHB9708 TaxID=1314777 RepID=A0A164XP21_9AGAM|nr:S-adenosyl-L-methionine-dependent methyltransferase [Sistotremastrum niveocremeum HHB9708]